MAAGSTGQRDSPITRSRWRAEACTARRTWVGSRDWDRRGCRLALVEDRTGRDAGTLFSGIDTTVATGSAPASPGSAPAPGADLAGLLALRARWTAGRVSADRLAHLDRAIVIASGVVCDARSDDDRVVPGQRIAVALECWNTGTEPHTVTAALRGGRAIRPDSAATTLRLEPGALVRRQVTATVAADAPPTAPYFHLSASQPGAVRLERRATRGARRAVRPAGADRHLPDRRRGAVRPGGDPSAQRSGAGRGAASGHRRATGGARRRPRHRGLARQQPRAPPVHRHPDSRCPRHDGGHGTTGAPGGLASRAGTPVPADARGSTRGVDVRGPSPGRAGGGCRAPAGACAGPRRTGVRRRRGDRRLPAHPAPVVPGAGRGHDPGGAAGTALDRACRLHPGRLRPGARGAGGRRRAGHSARRRRARARRPRPVQRDRHRAARL